MKTLQQFALFITVLCGISAPVFASEITVYKSATCGCCKEWVKHLQANGFSVKAQDVSDLRSYKTANGVPQTSRPVIPRR